MIQTNNDQTGLEIAIIGMSCRFPEAENVDVFWENLKAGKASVSKFTDEELLHSGISEETIKDPRYVKAGGAIEGTESFDLNVFEYSPREAEVMDPQLKVLHECAWEALEHSGYLTADHQFLIGTYIGASTNLYWMGTVFNNAKDYLKEAELLNGSQFFSTRIAHKLNLKGPSYTVQTACSSSLVAIHLACQALLSGDCDISLAGGVSLTLPEKRGHMYQDGMILSPDGQCRPFDEDANGTVNGNGAGFIVLKRLEDAINDGDSIHAVIKGSAINNDGADKVSFTAPSVEGQANVIKAAHRMADVEPETISYVEAHGTGTKLGDPIEVEALKLAFNSKEKDFCGLGSVKANIGHLDNAAGIAGVIKTVQAIKHKMIPPSINYKKANKNINFESSPFYVNSELIEWNSPSPLRAGVSSFGMGGTNAHIVLEEAPKKESELEIKKDQLLCLSAQTKESLESQTKRLAIYLKNNQDVNLADVSYTLLNGRKKLKYKRAVVASDAKDASEVLETLDPLRVMNGSSKGNGSQTVFMFPGQGSQYINMGLDLYKQYSVFRNEIDRCFHLLQEISGTDFKKFLYPSAQKAIDSEELNQTLNTQPIMFSFEYATAKLLMHWGIQPQKMIGHSLGEYVASCLSGVLSLKDALKLVHKRATLMQSLSQGSMVSVLASADQIKPFLTPGLAIAAVNSRASCVVSGNFDTMSIFKNLLREMGCEYKDLPASHAFHSPMMEPILSEFADFVERVELNSPAIPYLSNVTGDWITVQQATSARYWVDHLRHTVLFSDGIRVLLKEKENVYLEVGPGRTLSTLLMQNIVEELHPLIINTVRHSKMKMADDSFLLQNLGKLFVNGIKIDWMRLFGSEKRTRIPLPTYPFDRTHYSVLGKEKNVDSDVVSKSISEINISSVTRSKFSNEEIVLQTFKDVTGLVNIDYFDNFFEKGGDSLTAVNVVTRLQKEFDITINHLFEFPTAYELAKSINHLKDKQFSKKELAEFLTYRGKRHQMLKGNKEEYIEKKKEYEKKLISIQQEHAVENLVYKNILLTGSTGYLGIYLLRDLLIHTGAAVHLIVRGNNVEGANKRLQMKVISYFGEAFYNDFSHRLFVYAGDLVKKNLGLDPHEYEKLSKSVECIIHSAGNVSHYGKYEDSFNMNVKSTKNLVEFSLRNVKKDFNHISTLAVASGNIDGYKDILFTEYDHDLGQSISNPYPNTKLEAEKVLTEVRSKGVCVNIFRVGNIVFDSESGRFQENIEQNAIYTMLRSYIALGFVPEMERDTDFSCVDDVSRAITCLFNKKELRNETYHISNPEHVSFSDLLTMPGLNIEISKMTLQEFIYYIYDDERYEQHAANIYNLQLHSVGEDLSRVNHEEETVFHIKSDKTNQQLKNIGFEWRKIDDQLIKKMIQYGQEVNYFQNKEGVTP